MGERNSSFYESMGGFLFQSVPKDLDPKDGEKKLKMVLRDRKKELQEMASSSIGHPPGTDPEAAAFHSHVMNEIKKAEEEARKKAANRKKSLQEPAPPLPSKDTGYHWGALWVVTKATVPDARSNSSGTGQPNSFALPTPPIPTALSTATSQALQVTTELGRRASTVAEVAQLGGDTALQAANKVGRRASSVAGNTAQAALQVRDITTGSLTDRAHGLQDTVADARDNLLDAAETTAEGLQQVAKQSTDTAAQAAQLSSETAVMAAQTTAQGLQEAAKLSGDAAEQARRTSVLVVESTTPLVESTAHGLQVGGEVAARAARRGSDSAAKAAELSSKQAAQAAAQAAKAGPELWYQAKAAIVGQIGEEEHAGQVRRRAPKDRDKDQSKHATVSASLEAEYWNTTMELRSNVKQPENNWKRDPDDDPIARMLEQAEALQRRQEEEQYHHEHPLVKTETKITDVERPGRRSSAFEIGKSRMKTKHAHKKVVARKTGLYGIDGRAHLLKESEELTPRELRKRGQEHYRIAHEGRKEEKRRQVWNEQKHWVEQQWRMGPSHGKAAERGEMPLGGVPDHSAEGSRGVPLEDEAAELAKAKRKEQKRKEKIKTERRKMARELLKMDDTDSEEDRVEAWCEKHNSQEILAKYMPTVATYL